MNRRNARRLGQILGGTALVISACGQAEVDPGSQSPAQLGKATSPQGLICGVIDQSHISDIFGVSPEKQSAKTDLKEFPKNSKEFDSVSCSVSNSENQGDLLSLEISRGPFNEKPQWNFLKDLERETKDVPDALTLPSMLGEGIAAPGVGGYIVRECPGGKQYLLAVTTRANSGSATKWLRLLSAAVPLADALGACPPGSE